MAVRNSFFFIQLGKLVECKEKTLRHLWSRHAFPRESTYPRNKHLRKKNVDKSCGQTVDRHTERQRQTDRHTQADKERQTDTDRDKERQSDRHKQTKTDRETDGRANRPTDRRTD